jgi:parallel beta-helix repeat protein
VTNNTTIDEIWAPDTSSDPGDAAAGIIIVGADDVQVGNNVVGSTQFGIGTFTDPGFNYPGNPNGLADHSSIRNNQVFGTQIFDGIDVCSNNNTIQGNTIFSATESAIHLDSSCGTTGENNTVSANLINEACTGILEGAKPNSIGLNIYLNVASEILAGNVCPAASTPTVSSSSAAENTLARPAIMKRQRPSPAH